MATNSIYVQVRIFSQPIEFYKWWADRDLHASAILTEIEWLLFIPPNVLREFGAFCHLESDFINFVVSPSSCVAPTDCTLTFVDFLWLTRHDHGDGTTVAGGSERFVRHLDRKIKVEQIGLSWAQIRGFKWFLRRSNRRRELCCVREEWGGRSKPLLTGEGANVIRPGPYERTGHPITV